MSMSQHDEKLSELMDEFGAEGYGVWWLILEKIAQLMDESERTFIKLSQKVWINSLRIPKKKFKMIVEWLGNNGIIFLEYENEYLTISCPNLLKYRDEWTERKIKTASKTREQLGSNSGATPVLTRASSDSEADTDSEANTNTELKEKIQKKKKPSLSLPKISAAQNSKLALGSFEVSAKLRAWCAEKGHFEPENEVESFKDHHESARNWRRYSDWDATFRNWMRNKKPARRKDVDEHGGGYE